jgi:hypothetical protein
MDGPIPWFWATLSRRQYAKMTGCAQTDVR